MHRRLIYFAGRCDRTLPLLYGRWHGEAVTEGLKFIKRRKFTAIGGMKACRPTPRNERMQDDFVCTRKIKILAKIF